MSDRGSDNNVECTPSTSNIPPSAKKVGSVQRYPLRKGVLKATPSALRNVPDTPKAIPCSSKTPFKVVPSTSKDPPKDSSDTEAEENPPHETRKRKLYSLEDILKMDIPKKKRYKKPIELNKEDPLQLQDLYKNIDKLTEKARRTKYKNSFIVDFDTFLHNINEMIIDYENVQQVMIEFATDQVKFRKMVESMHKDWKKQKKENEKLREELASYSDKLNLARKLLDREKKERFRIENEKNCFEGQMAMARDLLFSDKCRNRLPEDTREKLAFLNNTSIRSRPSCDNAGVPSYPNRLNTINEVNSTELNSTGSLLSELSYSRSEDDLDVSLAHVNNKWKKFQPPPIIEETPASPPKKRKSSTGNVVEISRNEKIVATTTVSVSKDGPIHATSIIESVPVNVVSPGEVDEARRPTKRVLIPSNPQQEAFEKLFEAASSGRTDILKREHTLVQKTTMRPMVCAPCNKRISFGKMMLKCKDCRAVCHPDCKFRLPLPCIPTVHTPKEKKISGTIVDYVPPCSPMIPVLLIHCVNEVELRGLSEVGLYRIPGSERDVKQLKEKFIWGKVSPNLADVDIHVICGCIKDFLRSLREPLIPTSLWKVFVNAVDNRLTSEIPALLYSAIAQLPQANRDTLAYMILHLQRVAENKECKMPVDNLAKVFGPTIVGYSSTNIALDSNMLTETRLQSVVMEYLLNIPADYWSSIINTKSQTPSGQNIVPSCSTGSLHKKLSAKSLFTPLTENRPRKPKKFFTTPTKL